MSVVYVFRFVDFYLGVNTCQVRLGSRHHPICTGTSLNNEDNVSFRSASAKSRPTAALCGTLKRTLRREEPEGSCLPTMKTPPVEHIQRMWKDAIQAAFNVNATCLCRHARFPIYLQWTGREAQRRDLPGATQPEPAARNITQ